MNGGTVDFATFSYPLTRVSPGGGIGRRTGLKILYRVGGVRVQVPPRAL